MKLFRSVLVPLFAVGAILSSAQAHDAGSKSGSVLPRFNQPLPNVPGKSMIAVEVTLAPGQASVAHRHAKSAFIMAYVLKGTIRNQIEGEAAKDYHVGDTWYEAPGAHHVQAINLSKKYPAKLLAIFVVDSDEKNLTVNDAE